MKRVEHLHPRAVRVTRSLERAKRRSAKRSKRPRSVARTAREDLDDGSEEIAAAIGVGLFVVAVGGLAWVSTLAVAEATGRTPGAVFWEYVNNAAQASIAKRGAPRGQRAADLALLGLVEPFSVDDVERARRQAARRVHPDKGGDGTEMVAINLAADRLKASASKRT
jgi:hypothetical protein